MTQTEEIRCPKCNSNQLFATKKGFSGKKAVVGGLLTGGIGILAGTIGSNNVKITCLVCGKEFQPGEGIIEVNFSKEIKIKCSFCSALNYTNFTYCRHCGQSLADSDKKKFIQMK